MKDDEYNEIKLQKIPLAKFLSILLELFNNGVEYIDIVGITDEQEDYVGISVIKEYLSENLREKFDDMIKEDGLLSKINIKPDSPEGDELSDLI